MAELVLRNQLQDAQERRSELVKRGCSPPWTFCGTSLAGSFTVRVRGGGLVSRPHDTGGCGDGRELACRRSEGRGVEIGKAVRPCAVTSRQMGGGEHKEERSLGIPGKWDEVTR